MISITDNFIINYALINITVNFLKFYLYLEYTSKTV